MKFIKIKASWEDYPDRLNRIFVIREDLSLYDLGVTLCKLFKTKFEHMFAFYAAGSREYFLKSYFKNT